MNYPELLSATYAHFSELLKFWEAEMERHENIGALVFLPEGYSGSKSLEETKFDFWPLPLVQAYLAKGGKTDEGLIELTMDFEFGEEFLVMIVAYAGDVTKHEVYVHKITRMGLS